MDIPTNLRNYFVVFFKQGPAYDPNDSARSTALMREHLAYSRRQAEAGHFVLYGPLMDDGDVAGLTVIDAASLEEAAALAKADPAVTSGEFAVVLYLARFPPITAAPTY